MPPQWMWHLDEELVEWFEDVEAKREEKYGGTSSRDTREESPMMRNQLSRNRR